MANSNNTPNSENTRTALVAGGCFWCVEHDLRKLPGVVDATSGYADGDSTNPTYETYGDSGHREVVEVTYNPSVLSFEELIIYTIKHLDPTDGDGSFNDRGEQYAPALYYETDAERETIEQLLEEIETNGPYTKPLAVTVKPRPTFFRAEDYHQNYASGVLSGAQYKLYRRASGRDAFIAEHWGTNTGPTLPWRDSSTTRQTDDWSSFKKPAAETLRTNLSADAYRVTQEDKTERAHSSPLDREWRPGIYVDVVSGEPLFSSRDKFDSGTGWPSFTKPITPEAVTEHTDTKLFMTRTEVRSRYADSHLGHVFTDGPADRGGLRYCMNGAALHFVPRAEMADTGYAEYLDEVPEE